MFSKFLKENCGAAAAEYVLLLAIIASGIVVSAGYLGEQIAGALNDAGACIEAGKDCVYGESEPQS